MLPFGNLTVAFVAPLVGAWVEITYHLISLSPLFWSLPSWERGLKSVRCQGKVWLLPVAPLVGAWVEIANYRKCCRWGKVAPLAGAWVEIILLASAALAGVVAPLAGAWVEMFSHL